jgi:hypothetical protein
MLPILASFKFIHDHWLHMCGFKSVTQKKQKHIYRTFLTMQKWRQKDHFIDTLSGILPIIFGGRR